RSILIPGPEELDLRMPILSPVHHIVGVVMGAPSAGLQWRSLISALPTEVVRLAVLKAIVHHLLLWWLVRLVLPLHLVFLDSLVEVLEVTTKILMHHHLIGLLKPPNIPLPTIHQ